MIARSSSLSSARRAVRSCVVAAGLAIGLGSTSAACSAGESPPSTGSYTIQFPSTSAAVATDTVQIFVFDPPADPAERPRVCEALIQARRRGDPLRPLLQNAPVNICELLQGRKPITIPYGERVVLAVAQRRAADFMIGCVIQTIGDGDAPRPIPVGLIDVATPVPQSPCATVTDFCLQACPAL